MLTEVLLSTVVLETIKADLAVPVSRVQIPKLVLLAAMVDQLPTLVQRDSSNPVLLVPVELRTHRLAQIVVTEERPMLVLRDTSRTVLPVMDWVLRIHKPVACVPAELVTIAEPVAIERERLAMVAAQRTPKRAAFVTPVEAFTTVASGPIKLVVFAWVPGPAIPKRVSRAAMEPRATTVA